MTHLCSLTHLYTVGVLTFIDTYLNNIMFLTSNTTPPSIGIVDETDLFSPSDGICPGFGQDLSATIVFEPAED